jgi:hypothetical protein
MSRFVLHKILPAVAAFTWLAVLVAQPPAAQQTIPTSQSVLAPVVRLEQDVIVPTTGAVPQKVRVVLANWGIHGTQKIDRFPEQGFMIIQLHSGNVTIVINGKEEKHRGGDFWTVPAGATMSVQVTSESAVLQTMAIRSTTK